MKYTARYNKQNQQVEWQDPDGNVVPPPASKRFDGLRFQSTDSGWPIHCEASACHPDSIPEYKKMLVEKGVPTDYDSTGRPILTNRRHRRRFLKAMNLVDRSSYFGY